MEEDICRAIPLNEKLESTLERSSTDNPFAPVVGNVGNADSACNKLRRSSKEPKCANPKARRQASARASPTVVGADLMYPKLLEERQVPTAFSSRIAIIGSNRVAPKTK